MGGDLGSGHGRPVAEPEGLGAVARRLEGLPHDRLGRCLVLGDADRELRKRDAGALLGRRDSKGRPDFPILVERSSVAGAVQGTLVRVGT